jgi:hypothetical protein
MDNYNHFFYAEQLAKWLKPISHDSVNKRYFRATGQTKMQELMDNFRSVSGAAIIAVDGKIIDFGWSNSDSLMIKPLYEIVILFPAQSKDADSIFIAQEKAKNVAFQCIAKIMHDARKYLNGCDKIDPASFQIDGFGPFADYFFGVELSFSLSDGLDYQLNAEMWNS